MNHHATIQSRIVGSALYLLAEDAVFHRQSIVRELLLVKEMGEAVAEVSVLVIRDFDDAVFDAKGLAVVISQFVASDLDHPAVQVLAIEQIEPVGGLLSEEAKGSNKGESEFHVRRYYIQQRSYRWNSSSAPRCRSR